MYGTPLRYKLAQMKEGIKLNIVAKYGDKIVYDEEQKAERVLLKDVFNRDTKEYLCDHLWVFLSEEVKNELKNNLLVDFLVIAECEVYRYYVDRWCDMYTNYSLRAFKPKLYVAPVIERGSYNFIQYKNLDEIRKYSIEQGQQLKFKRKLRMLNSEVCFIPNGKDYFAKYIDS